MTDRQDIPVSVKVWSASRTDPKGFVSRRNEPYMRDILRSKFSNPVLAKQLLDTNDAILEAQNTWHDNLKSWNGPDIRRCEIR